MKVDILSDTHFDNWFGYNTIPDKETVVEFWRSLKPKGDYLIIAGDIGHDLIQNIAVLNILKEVFYKEIIITLGNHDHYVIGFNLLEKVISFIIHKDKCREIDYLNFPDCFHSQLRILQTFYFFDILFG